MMHLEIEDWAARDAVDSYQMEMELFILRLLGENRDSALAQIEEARGRALDRTKNFVGVDYPIPTPMNSMEVELKIARITIDLLESTFSRLQSAYQDDDTGEV